MYTCTYVQNTHIHECMFDCVKMHMYIFFRVSQWQHRVPIRRRHRDVWHICVCMYAMYVCGIFVYVCTPCMYVKIHVHVCFFLYRYTRMFLSKEPHAVLYSSRT